MKIKHVELGICGLSCRICPNYHMETKSRCLGCKSEDRMAVGCPFITCAIKKKEVEFCWECKDNTSCQKWREHREISKTYDSFKCYQKLNDEITFIQKNGVAEFEDIMKIKEQLLREMLSEFTEGRSKSYYCIAATVFEIDELSEIISKAREASKGFKIKEKAALLHLMLDEAAAEKGYHLKLRK